MRLSERISRCADRSGSSGPCKLPLPIVVSGVQRCTHCWSRPHRSFNKPHRRAGAPASSKRPCGSREGRMSLPRPSAPTGSATQPRYPPLRPLVRVTRRRLSGRCDRGSCGPRHSSQRVTVSKSTSVTSASGWHAVHKGLRLDISFGPPLCCTAPSAQLVFPSPL